MVDQSRSYFAFARIQRVVIVRWFIHCPIRTLKVAERKILVTRTDGEREKWSYLLCQDHWYFLEVVWSICSTIDCDEWNSTSDRLVLFEETIRCLPSTSVVLCENTDRNRRSIDRSHSVSFVAFEYSGWLVESMWHNCTEAWDEHYRAQWSLAFRLRLLRSSAEYDLWRAMFVCQVASKDSLRSACSAAIRSMLNCCPAEHQQWPRWPIFSSPALSARASVSLE